MTLLSVLLCLLLGYVAGVLIVYVTLPDEIRDILQREADE